jgi:Cu/Zn superoxide dismutase
MFRRTALAVGIAASVLVAGVSPAGASGAIVSRGYLRDLAPAAANVTDGARASVVAIAGHDHTFVLLVVRGLDPAAVGLTFGAHVHVGPCVAGDGAAAGPHYNSGGPPSPTTEVWLDFTVRPGGIGVAHTRVPFVIPPGGAGSVVIHAMPTDPMGVAGARQACLPVAF